MDNGERQGRKYPSSVTSFYKLPKKYQEQIREVIYQFGIKNLWLFGSYKNGTYTEDSDVDLGVGDLFTERFTYMDLDIFPIKYGIQILKNGKFI